MPKTIRLNNTPSTNDYLQDLLLREVVAEGTVVIADSQTAGKGQRGNGWESEAYKNLTFSIVIYPTMIRANELFIISQMVSLAIKDVLSMYTDHLSIKWPNDIYRKEKKIGGILIENKLSEDNICQSIIGIGLNVNQEKFVSDAPNPTSLKQITGQDYQPEDILQKVSERILYYYENIKDGNTQHIKSEYRNSLFRNDGYHLYYDGIIDFLAQIKDVEPSGILVLETMEKKTRRFAFKEVQYII